MPSRSKKTLCKMSLEKLQAQLPICALYEKANMIFFVYFFSFLVVKVKQVDKV